MKKVMIPLLLGATISSSFAANDKETLRALERQVEELRAQITELKSSIAQSEASDSQKEIKSMKSQISEVKKHTAGDNIKWDVDFRTAYDQLNYKINDGQGGTEKKHNGIWTNKLILGMSAQPFENLVFRGSIAAYKAYGENNVAQTSYFQNFDWYNTNKPNDATLRLREAYFLYLGQIGAMPYTVSFGRRPSLDGFLTNLRIDNAEPASPTGHNINMQFDGASFKFDFDELTGIPGLYAKLCIGRGFSETTGAYSMNMSTMGFNPGYINDEYTPDMDMAGFIVQFFNNGQYKLLGNWFYAKNLMDMDIQGMSMGQAMTAQGPQQTMAPMFKFTDVGDMTGGALSFQMNGIGDGISDFLDDTVFFASYAFSKTKPNNNVVGAITPMGMGQASGMLGSTDSKVGHSFYIGLQMPGFGDKHRFGLEYNHGSKYWRSFTYGEDTLVGSKLAARGNAYEAYYTLPIVSKNLTAQLSYLYVDYDYTGSDTFFGWTGTPMKVEDVPGAVKSAQEVRAYLRYRY